MEELTVGFIRASETTDAVKVNYITRILTGPYIHCELIFRDQNTGKRNLACSVMYGRDVYMEPRNFTRDEWSFIKVPVNKRDYHKIKKWCEDIVEKGTPFNNSGFYRAITPFPRHTDDTQFFCTELACRAFQQIGVFMDCLPSTLSPTEFKAMLDAQFDTSVDMSPNVDSRIKTKGLKFGGAVSKAASIAATDKPMLKHSWNSIV